MTITHDQNDLGITNEAFESDEENVMKRNGNNSFTSQSSLESRFDQKQSKKRKKKAKKEEQAPEQPSVSLFELFRFASAADITVIIFACLCAAATGICLPIVIILYGDLTDSFVNNGLNATYVYNLTCGNISAGNETLPPDTDALQDTFRTFGIYTSVIATILLILGFSFVTLLNYVAENQVYRIRKHFLSAMLRQDVAWFDTKSSNDFASRITEDLNKIQDGIGEKIGMLVFSASTFLSTTIIAFIHGWQLTLVMMVSTPVLAIAMGIVAKVQSSLTESELKAYAKSGGVAEEVLNSIRTVMAFNGQQKEVERFQKNLATARKAGVKRGLATATGSGLTNGILYSSFALAFWYGITLILDACNNYNAYSASDLLIVFFNVLIGAMQIGQATPYLEALNVARGAAATIFSVIDRVPPIDSSSKLGDAPEKLQGKIAFKNVRFDYPSRPDVKILQGLSFDISPGQTVALVGSSGCGKSTCVQLVQRFYDPLEGSVEVDDKDIRQLNLAWLRSQIGVVGQEPVLFGTTIGENIRFGSDNVTQEEIERAAKEANAYDFIQKLPKKFETMVGERGAQLSGGQKQRIAIARALVRNPKILLLDEATSALDTQSEAVVQKALDKARLGRTTIIVAHRLTTIRNADRIIVLRHGILEEDGTHRELMEKQGVYFQLVLAQQGGKVDPAMLESDTASEEESSSEDETRDLHINRAQTHQVEDVEGISASFPHGLGSIRRKNYRPSIASSEESSEDSALDTSLLDILKMNKKEWPFIALGAFAAAVNGASTLVYAILFGEVLGVLTPSGDEELQAQKREEGNFYSLMFLILGIVSGVAAFVQSFSFSVAGEALTSRLRDLTFQAILKQEVAYFDDDSNNVGALCARMAGDASSVQGATGARIGVICQAISTLVIAIILSLYYDWRLGLVATAFIPLVFIATYLQGKVIMSQSALERKALQQSSKIAMEAISNIRTVASLGKEDMFHAMYVDALRDPHRSAKKKSWVRGAIFGFANSIPMYSYATTLYYGGWLVAYAGLPFENVIKVTEALTFGTQTIAQALAFAPNYNKAKVAAARIFCLLRREPKINATSKEGDILTSTDGNVDYDSIEFRYPTRRDVKILQGLSLAVEAGQTVALVGHSGCGKSTCIQLLERFYDPDSGEVRLDEMGIKQINISSLRSKMGIVSQEPILFNMTLRENIEYGDNGRRVPMDEVIEAARKANIHTFIQSLPSGYETMVGERGTQLSGGQKQRVAIARALVRNPKILLLDEATSALDSESEKVVQMALDAAREGRTCITIAHRLSTIQNADRIFVFNNGKVQEQGTHEQLLKLGGLYYELCTVQGISHE